MQRSPREKEGNGIRGKQQEVHAKRSKRETKLKRKEEKTQEGPKKKNNTEEAEKAQQRAACRQQRGSKSSAAGHFDKSSSIGRM